MTRTVVMTGATGFLGSRILHAILALGEFRVIALKRTTSDMRRVEDLRGCNLATWADVDAGADSIRQVFAENSVSAVIHCATEYGRGLVPIADILKPNLLLPISLLDLCIEFGVNVFINTDSYFNKPSMQYPYLLDYSLSKKSLLLWLPYFAKKVRVANMTLEHIFGPYDGQAKFVSQMIRHITIAREKSVALSPGGQLRDFIYVDDAASAYVAVLLDLVARDGNGLWEYEVGTGAATSIKDFVEEIKSLSASETELRFGDLPYRESEIMYSCADNAALRKLGWKPRHDYRSGLATLLQIERKEQWTCR